MTDELSSEAPVKSSALMVLIITMLRVTLLLACGPVVICISLDAVSGVTYDQFEVLYWPVLRGVLDDYARVLLIVRYHAPCAAHV